jgi:hypothetical protein
MTDSPDTTIEALNIITGFLSDNSIAILVLVLLIIGRQAISSFISRLTSLSFRRGESELGLEAASPSDSAIQRENLESGVETPAPQKHSDEGNSIEQKAKDEDWFSEMHTAFEDGRFEDAEKAFKEYALSESNEVMLEKNKAF